MWKRKPTIIGGQTADGDFLILRDRQVVGRVSPAHLIEGAQPYIWATYTYPPAHGRADSLIDAEEAVRWFVRSHWPDSVMHVPLAAERGKPKS